MKRLQRRAELEAKRKEREEEKARMREERKKQKEKEKSSPTKTDEKGWVFFNKQKCTLSNDCFCSLYQ